MTAVRVHILTTEGPATVQGLVVESYDNDVLATICLDGTTEQLPICRDYHMFVDQFIRPLPANGVIGWISIIGSMEEKVGTLAF